MSIVTQNQIAKNKMLSVPNATIDGFRDRFHGDGAQQLRNVCRHWDSPHSSPETSTLQSGGSDGGGSVAY